MQVFTESCRCNDSASVSALSWIGMDCLILLTLHLVMIVIGMHHCMSCINLFPFYTVWVQCWGGDRMLSVYVMNTELMTIYFWNVLNSRSLVELWYASFPCHHIIWLNRFWTAILFFKTLILFTETLGDLINSVVRCRILSATNNQDILWVIMIKVHRGFGPLCGCSDH